MMACRAQVFDSASSGHFMARDAGSVSRWIALLAQSMASGSRPDAPKACTLLVSFMSRCVEFLTRRPRLPVRNHLLVDAAVTV